MPGVEDLAREVIGGIVSRSGFLMPKQGGLHVRGERLPQTIGLADPQFDRRRAVGHDQAPQTGWLTNSVFAPQHAAPRLAEKGIALAHTQVGQHGVKLAKEQLQRPKAVRRRWQMG